MFCIYFIADFDQNDSNCLRDFNLCIAPHQGDEVDMPSSQTLFSHFGTLKKSIKKVSLSILDVCNKLNFLSDFHNAGKQFRTSEMKDR